MIFDVPAESGGALSILNQYYNEAIKDSDTNYIFVLSVPELTDDKNVKVINYKWIKKSWFHRLFFDLFISNRIVKKYKPDEVLSLQNIHIKKIKVKQTLYVHQAIPFSEYKFKFFKNKKYWIYQNVIGYFIKQSISKVDKVIVQTEWMKDKILKINSNLKVIVESPSIDTSLINEFNYLESKNFKTFFYPANDDVYKNHEMIINVVSKLVKNSIDCIVLFTIDLNHVNDNLKKILLEAQKKDLPIKLLGNISREEVFRLYSESVLLFASDIESFGLPILEARLCEGPIIAKNTDFSNEILMDYKHYIMFENEDSLQKAMESSVKTGYQDYLINRKGD
ncbi:glycosyltransferase [Vagococcus fluvialis]|uniref:glycosyltransferase n=1 Tax=Vagococcus fluvialis TaxID=2738 RepID=UPI003873B4AA